MMNIAKFNMIEQQIRPWNVHSPELIDALFRLDRSLFVPPDKQAQCYFDVAITLDDRTRMLPPRVAARLIQALDIAVDNHVLLVGAGSGYTAALCAQLATSVVCHDVRQAVVNRAATNCAAAGANNISFQKVDSLAQPTGKVEFDAILIRERRMDIPQVYLNKLAAGGRCVVLLGTDCVTELLCYRRDGRKFEQTSVVDILAPENDMSGDMAQHHVEFIF